MPRVARCDECRKLFELPEEQVKPEEVEEVQSSGLMPVRKVFLCPACRQGARERGQPPAPPPKSLPQRIAETEAAGPPAATGPEGQPTHDEQPPAEEPPA